MTALENTTQAAQVTGTRAGVTRYPRYDAAELGFENYWYPVMFSRTLRKRPIALTLFGEHIMFGSIRESYASPCYGGGETGPVIGAGGEADEVEPAQVVVQIAGGDAAAGTQEVLQPAVAAVHRLHMQIAPNPFPHRAVECFVAHPRAAARNR